MSLENILSQEIVQKLGWTLLHFVWQATAVAVLLAGVLALLRKSTPNVRYIIACTALGLMVLLAAVTMPLVPVSPPQPVATVEPPPEPSVAPLQPTKEMPSGAVVEYEAPVRPESNSAAMAIPWKQRVAERLEPALPHLVTGWLLGVFGLSLWHLGGWAQLQRLRRKLTKPVDAALGATLKQLADKLGVDRAVELLESALVQVPTVVGWLRPVILLPASALTGLSTEQLEALLAHELAHIRRYDYLVNMLQTVVETLGFYHPAVWWISHKIRIERENCCDDLAVGICGDRIRYARALTSMEEIRSSRAELAVAASGGNLLARIHRLVSKNSIEKPSFGWVPAVAAILLMIALAIPTTLALTAKPEPQQTQEAVEPQESGPNTLPPGWSLDFDSGSMGNGKEHWIANMAKDLASLQIRLKPYDPFKASLKGERYEFDILSVKNEKLGYVRVEPESELGRVLPDNHILKPGAYLLRYTRRRGTPEDNLRIECGQFPVNLSDPGMYRFQFTPQLGTAEIAGDLGGCYAINSERVGKGPWVHGFAYQSAGKQYLLDGLPPGTYKLSAVTQDRTGNVFVNQAEVAVSAEEKATVNIVSPPRSNCSLKGTIRGRHRTYQPPGSTSPASEGRWFVLIRKLGSGPIETADAYAALTMDSLYVVRESNITQQTEDRAHFHIEGVAPGEYTVTAIEHPRRVGLAITRQQSTTLVLKDSEQVVLDFDLREIHEDDAPPSAQAESLVDSDSSGESPREQPAASSGPGATKIPAPSDADKAQAQTARVELCVVEVSSDAKMDGKTAGEINNLLGGKIVLADSPFVADLLKEASDAMAAVKDESAGDKRVTQTQFDTLFDVLVSRAYVKILMNPTLEVVEGQTAQIKTDQNSLAVTVNGVKDDAITLAIQADLSRQFTSEGRESPVRIRRTFSCQITVSPGGSGVIGPELLGRFGTPSDRDAGELLCIVTASITTPSADTKPQDQAAATKEKEYEVVQLRYIAADEAAQRVTKVLSQLPDKKFWPSVPILPLERGRQVIIFGRPDMRQRVKKLLAEIDVPSADAAIEGRVVYGKTGKSAAGVIVQAMEAEPGSTQNPWAQTVTDEQGRYRLQSLYGGEYGVWVEAENLTAVALDSFQVKAGQTREAPDLVLVEGGFIVGHVIDEATGQPVRPGQYSQVAVSGPSRPRDAPAEASPVREDGSFRIRVAPGRNSVALRPRQDRSGAKEYASLRRVSITVDGGETVEVELRVRKLSNEELSAERLMGIGRAMLAYAKDHDGKYPSSVRLYELREYLKAEERAWPRQYEYLADGRTTSDQADIVIYYDAQLFEQGKGTNVLFNDGHVEFVGPQRLNELNINKTQILIETRILEVTDDFLKENQLDVNSVRASEIRLGRPVADSPAEPNSLPYCLIFDDSDVDLLLKAMGTPQGKGTKMLTAPQARALDGRPVTIEIIRKLAVPGPSDPNDASGKAESKLQYVEVGTSIKITPDALPDSNNVLLDFEWEHSQVRDFVQRIGPDGKKQEVPVIDRYNMRTRATVPEGRTLLIGGKKTRRWVVTRTKRPLLGDLPLVGSLFRRESWVEETRNVLILIKPTIDPKKKAEAWPARGPGARPLDPNDPLIKKLERKLSIPPAGRAVFGRDSSRYS